MNLLAHRLHHGLLPEGGGRDQAYYFLGEIAFLSGDLDLALSHFEEADEITESQDVHDTVAFRIGFIFEALQDYEAMAEHFAAYIETYGDQGRITDAILELWDELTVSRRRRWKCCSSTAKVLSNTFASQPMVESTSSSKPT